MNERKPFEGLTSAYDIVNEVERKKRKTDSAEESVSKVTRIDKKETKEDIQGDNGKPFRGGISRLRSLDAYSRHKEIINLYYLNNKGALDKFKRDTSNDRTDYDVLKDNHKFLWDADDEKRTATSWEARMAKKYYDKLFKEYCIVDLTLYQKNKVGMRWRVEKEVLNGKGQFICGNKKCESRDDLTSWEVNFAYVEQKERKNALVKVRLCPSCSEKLNYGSQKTKYVKKKKSKRSKAQSSESTEGTSHVEVKQEVDDEPKTSKNTKADEIWLKPIVAEADRTVEDDIDDFLDDLFD
ncbi:unnamed protein product [Auanema sp. JU1783]|nr:unnamed protein product [Auanema sp. JU1783]